MTAENLLIYMDELQKETEKNKQLTPCASANFLLNFDCWAFWYVIFPSNEWQHMLYSNLAMHGPEFA